MIHGSEKQESPVLSLSFLWRKTMCRKEFEDKVRECGAAYGMGILDIAVLDHIIIGGSSFVSMKEK